MLLALDTSTRRVGLALYDGDRGLIAEEGWYSADRHTVELLPRAEQMLAVAGVGPADLCAVAVAIGPGSFTGLRVALAAAKGLALASGLPLLGVPTLDVVAYPYSRQPLPVIAVLPAGRGRVYWAPYGDGPTGWGARAAYALTTVAHLADVISQPTLIAGELPAAERQALIERAGSIIHLLPPALAARRAGYLAEIAWGRYVAGEADNPATLRPIYLHEPASGSSQVAEP